MKNLNFINLKYKPTKQDLVCLFKIIPNKMPIREAANNVALESSTGTWVEVKTRQDYVNKLSAKVFSIKGNFVKIAYPQELFEEGNAPNILSSIAGNIFGMKCIQGLRLEDVNFPEHVLKSFKGPQYGIKGIREILQINKRPLIGTIIKPKIGLNTQDHARVAYNSWTGGCDLVKDDENLSGQRFNEFEKRAVKTLEAKDMAEQETGEKKAYLINVTAETNEMIKRADLVNGLGGKFVMIDILTAGFASLQTLRNNTKLAIHAHRAMHGAFTENKNHGISMIVIAEFARLIGVDSLHIGTAIGKMKGNYKEVKEIEEEIESKKVKRTKFRLEEDWKNLKPVFAVCSGGLSPVNVPYLVKHFGNDIIIQAGGGIHGHPNGTVAGAKAMRQAIEASLNKISLKKYADKNEELKQAIEYF
ncbi:MAG: type III ribulose-bisphosphate carboxylase [Nanoarchaeota archaeon]